MSERLTKFFLKSKGIQGAVAALLIFVFQLFQVDLTQLDEATMNQLVVAVVGICSALWAAYGRLKAKGSIHFNPKKETIP